jgi:hypothetical protein
MARVVYDDVDAAAFGDDLFDDRVGRGLGLHIKFNGAEVDAVARRHPAISAAFWALRPATSRIEA